MSNHACRGHRCCFVCTGRASLVGLAVLGLFATGCSHQKRGSATQPRPVGDFSVVANNVSVTLLAGSMSAPEIIPSGWTNFIVTNGDIVNHTFGITGRGVDRLVPGDIPPGQSRQLRLRLDPGTYSIYCPTGSASGGNLSRQIVVAEW